MKCWSGASLYEMQYANGATYDGECIGHMHSPSMDEQRTYMPLLNTERALCHANNLHQQKIREDRWFICSTTDTATPLVLDSESKVLFDQFLSPQTLSALTSTCSHQSLTSIHNALGFFVQAGILSSTERAVPRPSYNQNETLEAWLHMSNSCNLGCSYCYIAKTAEHMPKETSQRSIEAIFRSARQHAFRQVTIRYAGGEPSLRLQQVLATHDYAQMLARDYHIHFRGVLLSNGILFTKEMIQQLKARQIGLMISLDGLGKYHDSQRPFRNGRPSFSSVHRTIERLLANDLIPTISVTVSRENLPGLPELISFLLKHQLPFSLNYYRHNQLAHRPDELQFLQQEMIEGIRAALQVIEAELPERPLFASLLDKAEIFSHRQYTCGVGRNYLVIDQNGKVARCHATIEQTVTSIDAPDPLEDIRSDKTGVQALPASAKSDCQSCQWQNWCSGGCPTLTHNLTGRSDVKSPNCGIYQALFPDILRLEALRILKYTYPYDFDI